MKIIRTTSENPDFQKLIKLLDADLWKRYPTEQATYSQHNKFPKPINGVLIFENEISVACGAFKEVENCIEIKRMFVHPGFRRKGFSKLILSELEIWGKELGYEKAILETGNKQHEAIGLYQKMGYQIIENYGVYSGMKSSICMGKDLF